MGEGDANTPCSHVNENRMLQYFPLNSGRKVEHWTLQKTLRATDQGMLKKILASVSSKICSTSFFGVFLEGYTRFALRTRGNLGEL